MKQNTNYAKKKQARQQNIKHNNQNTKYANQNTKYANQKFTLFCREAIFVTNSRTFLAYFFQAKKYGGVPKRTNVRAPCDHFGPDKWFPRIFPNVNHLDPTLIHSDPAVWSVQDDSWPQREILV